MDIKELDKTYVANTYGRADVVFVRGSGAEVYDDRGRRYIDLGAGIAVNAFGLADPVWVEAVTAQLSKLQHMSNLYYTAPCALVGLRAGISEKDLPHSRAPAKDLGKLCAGRAVI